ncbi:MAG: CCA tRNA nucleotidyltransferase [Candidatus Kaiserbacteria bacterium]|nr:CCA tRNA nucleotidyltransferase [Candidatus Kaiserbacteria bacterium]
MEKQHGSVSFSLPKHVLDVAQALSGAGFSVHLVGGCVRDLIMGRSVTDWDMTTDAHPDRIQEIFEHTVYENEYGTVGVVCDAVEDPNHRVIEVTPYRKEAGYSDNRRPDSVTFGASLEEDLARRDFTINALAYDPIQQTIVDPHGGIADLHRGCIRTVGDPSERFSEDALRLLRAVRIAAQLGGNIEEKTESVLKQCAPRITSVAVERIRDELVKITMSDHPADGVQMLCDVGLLEQVIPELHAGVGIEQNQAHSYDVFEHSIRTIEHAHTRSFRLEVRIAALLHDIGKVPTREWVQNKKDWTFHAHEVVGARMVRTILKRLSFSKAITETVTLLVRWHMFFSDPDQVSLSGVRRMIARVGEEHIWDLIDLRMCDRIGTGRPKEQPYRLRKYISLIEEVLREPVTPGVLALDGTDLMRELAMKPGPRVGHILHALLGDVLDDPKKNTKEHLIEQAKKLTALSDKDLIARGEAGKVRRFEEDEEQSAAIRKKYGVS